MLETKVEIGDLARKKLFEGIEIVAKAVGSTLGPMGQCVIIEREDMTPHVTKDGVSVSKAIKLKDRMQRLGADLIKEAASHTNDSAGDGTTTATILTHALCSDVLKYIAAGVKPSELVSELEDTKNEIIDAITSMARQVQDDDLKRIAIISANGELTIGDMVARAIQAAGEDGIVTVEESNSSESKIDIVDGMSIDRGYVSPYFINDASRSRCVLDDPYVLVCDNTITTLRDFIPVLEEIHSQAKSLLIITPGIEGEALQLLVLNKSQNDLKVCAVSPPSYDFGAQRSETLKDICSLVGTQLCSVDLNELSKIGIGELGKCKRVIIEKNSTTIVMSSRNNKAHERAQMIKDRLEEPGIEDSIVKMMKDRLSRLSGSAAVIRVGGVTEIEMRERRDRVDDALNATRAAMTEGVVPGGGVCLMRAAEKVKKTDKPGCKMLLEACQAPLKKLIDNSGNNSSIIIEKLKDLDSDFGFDARAQKITNVINDGIIDPAKVERVALENAVSVTKTFALLSAAIVNDDT